MGYEKLLLQGIPFSRLLLGPESEVQLSDLAGNAMSVPVVSATMLAALCAPQLRRLRQKDRSTLLANLALSSKYDFSKGKVLAERGDLYNTDRQNSTTSFEDVLSQLTELATDAYRSSVLCLCESSGTRTSESKILQCINCGLGICHDCTGRHQINSHEVKEVIQCADGNRPEPNLFERTLRRTVPSTLRLQGTSSLEHGDGLEHYSFRLLQVDRKVGCWEMMFGAWEDNGSGRQIAEIRVVVGRIGCLLPELGAAAYIRCYAPSIRLEKPLRGKLRESARLVATCNSPIPCWEVRAKPEPKVLRIVGTEECDSYRVQIGLNDTASSALRAQKVPPSRQPSIKSRNSLVSYHKLWKTWPATLEVSGDDRVSGTYRKLPCQHTTVLSALWRRTSRESSTPMYIYIRPDTVRSGLDVAVFSPTPSYKDGMELCELTDWIPENALEQKSQETKATFFEWESAPELRVDVPIPTMTVDENLEPFHDQIKSTESPVLCRMIGLSKDTVTFLSEHGTNGEIDLFGSMGTRTSKLLSILVAPELLKSAAESKLSLSLSTWYNLPDALYGLCTVNVPQRPLEQWRESPNRKGTFERFYDVEESKSYYQVKRAMFCVRAQNHVIALKLSFTEIG